MIDFTELQKGIKDCACGREHNCPIQYVVIAENTVNKIGDFCENYKSILLVSDKNTYGACGEKVYEKIAEKCEKNLVLENNGTVVIPNEEKIAEIEGFVTEKTDLIIGVGSGVINDLCKHVSFKHGLPYFIVATAPSMDGFASVGSALILDGMKVTLNARPPRAIFADSDVLAAAPLDMIKAGYGDIIGKYSCLNDWKLSALVNGEYFCEYVYNRTMETTKRVESLAEKIAARDKNAVSELMAALVEVGVMMSYVGYSRPASGSEHHMSHFFEIVGILNKEDYLPHGIDVAFSSVITAEIREKVLKSIPVQNNFSKEKWESEIAKIYGSLAGEIIALQNKVGRYEIDDSDIVLSRFGEIKDILSEAPTKSQVLSMLERAEIDYSLFEKTYGCEKIKKAVKYAKDLKDRYTLLNLYNSYFEV